MLNPLCNCGSKPRVSVVKHVLCSLIKTGNKTVFVGWYLNREGSYQTLGPFHPFSLPKLTIFISQSLSFFFMRRNDVIQFE